MGYFDSQVWNLNWTTGNLLSGLDSELALAIVSVVGIVVAIVAFVVGWLLINRRRARLRELARQAGEWKDPASPQDSFRYGMGMARRKSVRLSGNQIPVLVTLDGSADSPWDGWVIDRSQGGLRLKVSQAVKVGSKLRVRIIQASNSLPWAEVQVKNAREKQESWEIGCQFVGEPSPEVLRSFGSK
jgi:hypothetical protein